MQWFSPPASSAVAGANGTDSRWGLLASGLKGSYCCLGKSRLPLLRLVCISVVGKKKCRGNWEPINTYWTISSTLVMLSTGLRQPSHSLKELCFSPTLCRATFQPTTQHCKNTASALQGEEKPQLLHLTFTECSDDAPAGILPQWHYVGTDISWSKLWSVSYLRIYVSNQSTWRWAFRQEVKLKSHSIHYHFDLNSPEENKLCQGWGWISDAANLSTAWSQNRTGEILVGKYVLRLPCCWSTWEDLEALYLQGSERSRPWAPR